MIMTALNHLASFIFCRCFCPALAMCTNGILFLQLQLQNESTFCDESLFSGVIGVRRGSAA